MFTILCKRCAFNIRVSLKYSVFMHVYIVMYMLANALYMYICNYNSNDCLVQLVAQWIPEPKVICSNAAMISG